MYFNRRNAEQKNWRMIKKGKHFLFGCSLVFAVGATLVAPSVKADTVGPKPEADSTTGTTKSTADEGNGTYAAPAVEVAPSSPVAPATVVTEGKTEKAVETTQNSKEEPVVATEKAKEADSIQAPEVTVVYDPSALTDEEKAKVVAAVKAVNPTATDVQVQADGSVVVTFADGSRANLTAAQTIKDGSQVVRTRRGRALAETRSASTETRASDGAQNLDYSNKENAQDYVQISYEVDKANNVLHWTVLDNPGRKANAASGYVYFTIPKDSVGAPTNWQVVQTDKNGKVVNTRNYWKDNDGSYLMGQNGRMDTYTGSEMTQRLTQLYKDIKNPAIQGNEAAVAAQTAERSQALYTMTADNNAIRNVMWTITFDTPIVDKSKPLDYVAGMQGTGVVGGRTNIMTGYADNFIDNESSKFQAVAVKEKYTAKVGGSFDANPATYVTNKAGTPEFPNNYRGATTFAWKDGQAPTATQAGTYTKTVVVTYPAHYNQAPQEVTITFEVEGETPKPVAPAGQAPEITSNLDGKASTPADVTVKATAGSTVKLYNNDGVVIGEAVANDQGVATITPTNSLPEGEITATSTPVGGSESAKSAPITVTKTPLTYVGGGVSGDSYTQLLVTESHLTVYPGDPVNVTIQAAGSPSVQRFWIPNNPYLANGLGYSGDPVIGGFLDTAGTNTYRQRKAYYRGNVDMTQPAGSSTATYAVRNKNGKVVTRNLTITVLETSKKYTPAVVANKIEVADPNNVSATEKAAIEKAVGDANTALPQGTTYVADEKGNVTITYPDKSVDKISAAYLVTPAKDTTAPDKPVVNTDLTGKAGTKTPVEVTAEKGSTVALYDKDNNKIGEATAGENGKATITPTVDIPAGNVTAKATDKAGNTSVASDPKVATDTTAPAKPVVNTDLTGKAGTKTPVEVNAEPGSTVALYDKDNNKIGEATAGRNGKATITPTVDIPVGNVTAKATDASRNTSDASDPKVATDTTAPAKPVVNTDLAGKAGTKTPVEVNAEPGSTVALYDKDNNKIGEATAGSNGKATITPTVNIPAGNVTAKATDASRNTSDASDPKVATPAAPLVAPTVEIPYSNKATKEVYVYGGEENSFDIKFKDDSGKIASATVKQGGNRVFADVAGEANTINTQYGFKANVITTETPATADAPAVITYRGTPAATDGLTQDRLTAATKGENPAGLPLGWRFATATDTDGAYIENGATNTSSATDPGAFRVVLKAQNQKYDIATPSQKVIVADPSNVTEDDFAKIKEKVQLEYSQNNDDANLAGKKGTTADKTNKIQSITKDATGNLVVTYTDGSIDKKPLSEFVNVAPTVELPYSNQANKQIYVYTGENTDLTFKASDNTAVKDMYVRGPGGIGEDNTARYGFTTGKIENAAVTHGDGTVSGTTATIKMTGVTTLTAPNRWTSFVVANDNDNAPSNTDFNALDKNPNATKTPGYVQFIVKSQTDKYDIATPAPNDKVEVADPTNVTNDDLDKVKEKLQLEYNKKNDDANISKDSPVDKNGKIKSVTKDDQGNLVVTYTDGSKDTKPLSEFVTKATPAKPSTPVVNTDLTGKAGTKTPVEVTADPGTKVELFDKDGNKIGEGTVGPNGKATINPTVDIPAGNVTAKATKDGQPSDASAPKVATAATPAKPSTPVKTPAVTPVVNPSALTDAEKAKVADEVKKANPTAKDIKVNNDGSVVVTFADGSVAVLASENVVKEATKESPAQEPAKKAGAKELPNTGTKQSNASLGLALLAAVTGGLLIAKKREEEE